MKVFDNSAGGKLYICSKKAAVEFKSGRNPLDVNVLVQLNHCIPDGLGRYDIRWYGRRQPTTAANVLGTTREENPVDAVALVKWDVRSMTPRADLGQCPDIGGEDGRLAVVGRCLESLSQGKTVAV